jgi:hypothetical protein
VSIYEPLLLHYSEEMAVIALKQLINGAGMPVNQLDENDSE